MDESRPRLTRSQIAIIGKRLSPRDWQILHFVDRHTYVTTAHIRDALFVNHANPTAATRAAIRVLDRLLGSRLVSRLERRVGGNSRGSAATIWFLGTTGERLTRADPDGPRRRYNVPSINFLHHTLAIADAHIQILQVSQSRRFSVSVVQIETEAWRSYLNRHGTSVLLKPDLFVTLSTDEYDDHWYLEIDRGTESIPVLLTKCLAYAEYRRTGRAQSEHGVFPRVLWVLPSERRVARLKAAIAAHSHLPLTLFAIATPDTLISTLMADTEEEAIGEPDEPPKEGGIA